MRTCSLLPSATEIVASLGLAEPLVAVSEECDWPPEVRGLPVVTASRVDTARLSSFEINQAVREAVGDGRPLYAIDRELLEALEPNKHGGKPEDDDDGKLHQPSIGARASRAGSYFVSSSESAATICRDGYSRVKRVRETADPMPMPQGRHRLEAWPRDGRAAPRILAVSAEQAALSSDLKEISNGRQPSQSSSRLQTLAASRCPSFRGRNHKSLGQ